MANVYRIFKFYTRQGSGKFPFDGLEKDGLGQAGAPKGPNQAQGVELKAERQQLRTGKKPIHILPKKF